MAFPYISSPYGLHLAGDTAGTPIDGRSTADLNYKLVAPPPPPLFTAGSGRGIRGEKGAKPGHGRPGVCISVKRDLLLRQKR